ncbi:Lysophospholipase L1 [Dyella jiangningensis]|uniref:GDSL-type esterase/lipase family protein n=1 Tax=Dyella sp. AtDHG13 TaxID=1938897 RepID=UPI0008851A9D|nr:GDSL-type esterase/lipase family protein [Dyella sp. AtDHG13]PXV61489.1 lysophospholipase L1-like esterase [Dyella sp. AtDHG13]SDJ74077.1 Lysophospholipase L1 [Dyella jiangningensis]
MAPVSRFLMISAWCAGFFALSTLSVPAQAQDAPASFGGVSDLVCPNAPPAPPKPSPNRPAARVNMSGTQMPSDAELGPLARTVIRPQPLLDAQALAGFAPGSSEQARRIAIWGDSHIAGGPFASTLIQALRDKGLNVEPRLLPPTMGRANVILPGLRAYCIGSSWTTDIAYTSPTPLDIGPGLANRVVDAGPDSYVWLDVRNAARQADVRQLQVIYSAPAGASIDYVIDDGVQRTVNLPATNTSQALALGTTGTMSTIKLRVSRGKLVLQGFILDRPQMPDVSFDVFGLPSATVKGWANANPESLAQSLHGVSYDGVLLEFGTNEGADPDFDAEKYATMLERALGNLRQVFPKASCVLVGPPDRGVLRQGKGGSLPLLTYSRVHQRIEQVQRDVGSRYGCVAWSWQDLMGGPGGSYGWAHAQPSLMGHDLIHLSPDGYRLTGRSLAHSLGWSP